MTRRAEDVLRNTPIIACEDTRRTGNLLALLGLDVEHPGRCAVHENDALPEGVDGAEPRGRASKRRLIACHDHNEASVADALVAELRAGTDVVLVSDAGTPLLSDPGFLLVRKARRAGIAVRPIPGPSAVQSLLSVCPIPCERYQFEGFLPAKGNKRKIRLRELLGQRVPCVLFEAPHRVVQLLTELDELAADRAVFVGREMTKKHESFYQGTAASIAAELERLDALRGEFALCVAGAEGVAATGVSDERLQRALGTLAEVVGPSKAAKVLGQLTGRPRSQLYDLVHRSDVTR